MGTMSNGFGYQPCLSCGTRADEPCRALKHTRLPKGAPMTSVHTGRLLISPRPGRIRDQGTAEYRIGVWKRQASIGIPVADIAARLGMTRVALDQFICRERRGGNPDAILHLSARPRNPDPSWRTLQERRRRRDNRLRARGLIV